MNGPDFLRAGPVLPRNCPPPADAELEGFARDGVLVVGAGPVGVRFAQELHRLRPELPLLLLGDEPCQPYNRVGLSSALAGETAWGTLTRDLLLPEAPGLRTRFGCRVAAIDRERREVADEAGRRYAYGRLVLAVGSRPVIPELPGMRLPGVFTLRDLADAQRLAARVVRSRRTVVLGGGLLGLEAARGMRRFHTQVTVIDHADRLMSRQLDTEGGLLLAERVRAEGIEVILGDRLLRVLGEAGVAGLELRSGRTLACDTLVVAAGIRPNVELALWAGISVGRGIRVDDGLRTSDPHIYALGECAEHRGQVYGLVAPGYEQAAVAAHVIAGEAVYYTGSLAATRLKVLRCPVFSLGESGAEGLSNLERACCHRDAGAGHYRKIILQRGRLVGAMAVGEWDEVARLQEAVMRRRRVWPWQRLRFERQGRLWGAALGADVRCWPEAATVCNCTGVTRGQLGAALKSGCAGVEALAQRTGASRVCGTCRPLLAQLAGAPAEPPRGSGVLLPAGLAALVLAGLMAFAPGLAYPDTVQLRLRWDLLWRDGFWKQVSGYGLGSLMLLLALLGLRKRWGRFSLGDFAGWRVVHVLLGLAALAALLVHTGARLGSQLNLLLALCAVGAALSGGLAAWLVGKEWAPEGARLRPWRSATLWVHTLLLWPLPVLLAFHILKSYWF